MTLQSFRLATRALVFSLLPVLFIQCNAMRDLGNDPMSSGKSSKPRTTRTKTPRTTAPTTMSAKQEALRREVIAYAQQNIGRPYTAAGKTPSSGFDCSGFTSYVWNHFNVKLSPSARDQANQGLPKSVAQAAPGDLVFFRRSASEPIFHVALVVSNDGRSLKVIHSTSSRGVVVDDILASQYWKPKIDSVREVAKK
jgi:cell wall-associated NlpC family hydrolase